MMIRARWNLLQLANAVDNQRIMRLENRKRRRARALMRNSMDPFRDISEAGFIKTFRLGKETVRGLVQELTPFLPRRCRRDGISAEMKILIALAFYASGSYQTLVGQSALHNVSQKTVSRAVKQVTEALNQIYNKYVKWPNHSHDRNAIKAKFYQKFGLPGVLGCIDGTHVEIIRPICHEERFVNRKGLHSLNVMIICDSDLNILCVDASNPGSAHDSSVWQNHPLCQHLTENTEHGFLLGDSGYPLRRTMMTPILNTSEGTPQHVYNLRHVTARNTVERCIGDLKARFRCLLGGRALHYNPVTAGKIINACCVLHNIANKSNAPVPPLTPEEALRLQQDEQNLRTEFEDVIDENLSHRHRGNQALLDGRALQQALVNRLWENNRS